MKKNLITVFVLVVYILSICVPTMASEPSDKISYQLVNFSDSANVISLKEKTPDAWLYDQIRNLNRWRVLYNKDSNNYCFNLYLKYDISGINLNKMDKVELLLMQLNATGGMASYELYDVENTNWAGSTIANCASTKTEDISYQSYPLATTYFATSNVEKHELTYSDLDDNRVDHSIDITDYIKAKKQAGKKEVSFVLATSNSYMDIVLGRYAKLRVTNVDRPEIEENIVKYAEDNLDYKFNLSVTATDSTIDKLTVNFDDTNIEFLTEIGTNPYEKEIVIPANLMVNGAHKIKITAKDSDGYTTTVEKNITVGYSIKSTTVNASDIARVIKTDKDSIDSFFYDTWYLLGDITDTTIAINMVMYYKFDLKQFKNKNIEDAYFLVRQQATTSGVNYHYRLRDVTDTSWTKQDIQNSTADTLSNKNYQNYAFSSTPIVVSEFVPNVSSQGELVKLDITEYIRQKLAEGKTTVSMILGLDTSTYALTTLKQQAGLEINVKTETNPDVSILSAEFDKTKLVAGETVSYTMDVLNKTSSAVDVSLILGLFNEKNILVKTDVDSNVDVGSGQLKASMLLPSDISGYKLKAFAFKELSPIMSVDVLSE